jgi:hypothetical protein
MLGGAKVNIPNCVPSDVHIMGNILFKPQEWRSQTGSVKNLFEIKNGRRVSFEANILDGCWKDAQAGHAIALTPRNPSNTNPWVTVEDVEIFHNIMRNTPDGYAINILGTDDNNPTQHVKRITIHHNLFRDARNGIQVGQGVEEFLNIYNNTFPNVKWNLLSFYGQKKPDGTALIQTPLTYKANVATGGQYGIIGSPAAIGVPALTFWTMLQDFTENIIEKNGVSSWPAGNEILPSGTLASKLNPETFKLLVGNAGY